MLSWKKWTEWYLAAILFILTKKDLTVQMFFLVSRPLGDARSRTISIKNSLYGIHSGSGKFYYASDDL